MQAKVKVFEFAIDGDRDDLLGLEGNESDDEKDIYDDRQIKGNVINVLKFRL